MSPPTRLLTATLVACVAGTLGACHTVGCREGDLVCAALTDPTGTSGTGSTTTEPTTTTTTTTDATTEPTTEAPSTGTTVAPPTCGDGVVEGDEECDDGDDEDLDECSNACVAARCGDGVVQPETEECDDGDDDDTDSCVQGCKFAACGDGFLRQGAEACDDGPDNDDEAYGGCTTSCVFGPRCGDAKVNGPEDCDDKNTDETDGCLSMCLEARSCLNIKQMVPEAATGAYRIWPLALGGESSVIVWCDMDTDGGGYTYLKVDTEVQGGSDKGAVKAEAICQFYGMHLIVTRTPAHTKATYAVATTPNITPVEGGTVKSGVDYLAIMAIYPEMMGATCGGGGALNSDDCPDWHAWDAMPYWVTDVPVPGQPDTDHCLGCSMLYKWNLDGTLKSYTTIGFGEGASSFRFLCDIGDKHP